jgi:hypothetical protein
MKMKYLAGLFLTIFFATAGIAVGHTFGSAYGFVFVMMITPVLFLVKKYVAFK